MAPNRGKRVRGRAGPHPRTLITKRGNLLGRGGQLLQSLIFQYSRLFSSPTQAKVLCVPLGSEGHTSPSQLPCYLSFFEPQASWARTLSLSWRCTGPSEPPPEGALRRAGENDQCSCRSLGTEEVMWPWIRTQGGRRCLLSQPLVERVCLVGAVSLAISFPCACMQGMHLSLPTGSSPPLSFPKTGLPLPARLRVSTLQPQPR